MRRPLLISAVLMLLATHPVLAAPAPMDRMPPMTAGQMTPEQKAVTDKIMLTRRTLSGPLSVWVRSPKLAEPLAGVGEYIRFQALPKPVREFAIMIASSEWGAQLEWNLHYREAVGAGIRPEILQAIADRRRPDGMSPDETLVYDFSRALHRDHGNMPDALFEAVRARFGESDLVDLIGVNAYYGLVAMTANATRSTVPPSAAPVLKPLS